jgi:hypothetical protein
MPKFLKSSASIAVLAMAMTASAARAEGNGTPSTMGNTLYFQIAPNIVSSRLSVFVFGQANTAGTVIGANGFSQAFNLGAQGFTTVALPDSGILGSNIIENKGFRVTADTPISGYFLNRLEQTTDMTYLIDGARLGSDYFVSTYRSTREEQISIQATVDNTVVDIAPKSGSPFQITLDAGQTYQFVNSNIDQTGTRVTGSAPIAVFGGNICTNVPASVGFCDHIVEQMPSIDQLSSSYLLAQTPRTGSLGNVVRVVGTEANTEVRVNGSLVATLNAGQFYEGRVVGGQRIDATAPVLVAQYLIGQDQAEGANTDPAMTIVPGADQWLNSYVFATPSGDDNFPDDFITILAQTTDVSTLIVDGVLADASLFSPIAGTVYSFGSIDVSATSGPFDITAANPFLLLLSGFDEFDSYFTYGGAAFSPGASPPSTRRRHRLPPARPMCSGTETATRTTTLWKAATGSSPAQART